MPQSEVKWGVWIALFHARNSAKVEHGNDLVLFGVLTVVLRLLELPGLRLITLHLPKVQHFSYHRCNTTDYVLAITCKFSI